MKRLISIILAIVIVLSFAACGKKNDENIANKENETQQVTENNEETGKTENKVEEGKAEEKPETKPEAKPETTPEAKPEVKPETKPEAKPETKPETKPEAKPEVKPEPAPEPQPETNKSVGNTLLADFKAKASSSSSALSIAEGLLGNSVIKFSGGAMPVEPGYLTGFGNTEITGFKEGAMFAPMIGTIPFVGYVFILEDFANASSFISTLKSSADLRWNICTSADEMITGNVGNKVFFVMSPITFEE